MKKRSILCSLLSVIFAFGVAAACASSEDEVPDEPTISGGEQEEHLIEDTIHDSNITENAGRTFVNGGKTDYKLVMGNDSDSMKTAAEFIAKHVVGATGATLPTEQVTAATRNSWSSTDKLIVFDDETLFAKAGLTMPQTDIGKSGYYIKTVGNTVFIMCNHEFGYQMGAIKFLEAVVGYDMFSADCVVYERSGATIPDMEITERPDFEYRGTPTFKMSPSTAYGMGYNMTSHAAMFMPVPNRETGQNPIAVHNSFNYLPPSMYQKDHPKWFYSVGTVVSEQLCYTAHGDPDEYELMVKTLYEWLKQVVDDHPDMNNITITHQDNYGYCTCDACKEVVSEYGAISAAYIMFLNDVDFLLQSDLEEEAILAGKEKRDVNILLFAYHATLDAPAKRGEDGEFHPVSNAVKMNEHVGVFIAPISASYSSSLYEDVNREYAGPVEAWSCLTNKMYMWLYQTYFTNYFYPLHCWDTTLENYRFCIENNAIYMFNQGQQDQTTPTAFMLLKYYIDSKAQVNVNLNYKDLEEKFFRCYFKEAAEPMYKFFSQLYTHLLYLEQTDKDVDGRINNGKPNVVAKQSCWTYRTLTNYLGYIDEAYAAIADYEWRDLDTYNILKEHIMIESMFPRYAILTLYDGMLASNTLTEMRLAFINDCNKLGNTQEGEGATRYLSTLFARWGY